jgi:predicted nucleotidyltransferase
LIRQALPDARIVCIMSGTFTQRGSPALFSPAFRACAALRAGASMVLVLPCAFAVRDAEHFALGAVAILHQLGFITHLSFGCENDDLTFLHSAATLLENPTAAFQSALHNALSQGLSFASAQAQAIAAGLLAMHTDTATLSTLSRDPQTIAQALTSPNNILGICYLRALQRLHSQIQPLPVQRVGAYHATSLAEAGYPSASATRKAYLQGDVKAAEAACGYALTGEPCHRPDALDTVLLHTLRQSRPKELLALPDCSEGLENRLAKAAQAATSRTELLALIKTRRYARARLSRLVTHALLGITADMLAEAPLPHYARLLGFRRDAVDCLALLNGSRVPIIAKAADGDINDSLYALDARAYDLWALGAGLPAGLMFRQRIVIE